MATWGALRAEANEYFRQKKYFDAYHCYTAAIAKCPQTNTAELSNLYGQLSQTELILEKVPDAIRSATRVIELDRSNYRGYYRRGSAFQQSGTLQEAYEDFEEAARMQPSESYLRNRVDETRKTLKQLGKWEDKAADPPPVAHPALQPAPPPPRQQPPPPAGRAARQADGVRQGSRDQPRPPAPDPDVFNSTAQPPPRTPLLAARRRPSGRRRAAVTRPRMPSKLCARWSTTTARPRQTSAT
jgi:tetratricopeptide (TPR) repeat protein